MSGVTVETDPIHNVASLVHVGAAGGYFEADLDFYGNPIILLPGQGIMIKNPNAFDASGTWQVHCDFEWYEATAF